MCEDDRAGRQAGHQRPPEVRAPDAPTHPLLTQLADSKAIVGVQGAEEVLRVVLAAYRTFAAGRDRDPSAGTTTLDGPTVDACARLGGLIYQAGAS